LANRERQEEETGTSNSFSLPTAEFSQKFGEVEREHHMSSQKRRSVRFPGGRQAEKENSGGAPLVAGRKEEAIGPADNIKPLGQIEDGFGRHVKRGKKTVPPCKAVVQRNEDWDLRRVRSHPRRHISTSKKSPSREETPSDLRRIYIYTASRWRQAPPQNLTGAIRELTWGHRDQAYCKSARKIGVNEEVKKRKIGYGPRNLTRKFPGKTPKRTR